MNALLGSELIELLSLEKLVNQSRSLCHIVSALLGRHWCDHNNPGTTEQRCNRPVATFPQPGALFRLNGPAPLVRQEDPPRPPLAAACRLSGLPRAVHPRGPGQNQATGAARQCEGLEAGESTQESQGGKVRASSASVVLLHKCCTFANVSDYWTRLFSPLQSQSESV